MISDCVLSLLLAWHWARLLFPMIVCHIYWYVCNKQRLFVSSAKCFVMKGDIFVDSMLKSIFIKRMCWIAYAIKKKINWKKNHRSYYTHTNKIDHWEEFMMQTQTKDDSNFGFINIMAIFFKEITNSQWFVYGKMSKCLSMSIGHGFVNSVNRKRVSPCMYWNIEDLILSLLLCGWCTYFWHLLLPFSTIICLSLYFTM